MVSMGKVNPRDIHACPNHCIDFFPRITSRADRTDDLRPTERSLMRHHFSYALRSSLIGTLPGVSAEVRLRAREVLRRRMG